MGHRLVVEATPPCLERVHALLEAVWTTAPAVDPSVRTRFVLATAELVANVVEHGGGALPQPPRIVFEVEVDDRGPAVRGRIVDDGAAPPEDAAAGPALGAHDPFPAGAGNGPDGVPVPLSAGSGDGPDGAPSSLDDAALDALAESGRGLEAIRAAVDELGHERRDGRNVWVYVVRPR